MDGNRSGARRLLALFVAAVLAMGGVPAAAFARTTNTATAQEGIAAYGASGWRLQAEGWTIAEFGSLAGSGTQADPYQLANGADYDVLHAAVNDAGLDCSGLFFEQTSDVELSEGWTPIGCRIDVENKSITGADNVPGSNMRAFSGTLDGGGYTVTVPEGAPPLFGYVKGATICNLGVYGERIEGCGLIDNMEGVGLDGDAVMVENVTIKAGSSVLGSGILSCRPTTNSLAGVSAPYVSTIRNCTVEEGVVIGYDGQQSKIGSFAGRFNGTIENCESKATVKGVDYVGGIVGGRDASMGTYKMRGCTFSGSVEASGQYAGGIAGGNYDNATAPNGIKPTIEGCAVSGVVTGADRVGGIMGGDGFGMQAWSDEPIADNTFTGEVNATSGTFVGGIIGFYANLNRHDAISKNWYREGCGARNAFGKVVSVDTSNSAYAASATAPFGEDEATGAYYYCSSRAVGNQLKVADGAVKQLLGLSAGGYKALAHQDENRTDDPLCGDAASLACSSASGEPENVCVKLKVSGSYKTDYVEGEELSLEGVAIEGVWADGSKQEIALSDCETSGFDSSKPGTQAVIVSYGPAKARYRVNVVAREAQDPDDNPSDAGKDPVVPTPETPTAEAIAKNTLSVKPLSKSAIPAVTYGTVKTIAASKAFVVSRAQGAVTYKKTSGNAKIMVSANGAITVKKGLKVGTYPLAVAVTAAGNKKYKAATKTAMVQIRVVRAANKVVPKKTTVSKAIAFKKLKKKAVKVALPKVTTKFGKAKWVVVKKDPKKALKLKGAKVVVKKGAKKGVCTMKLKAKVAKTANYKASISKVVKVKVRVK